jgi:hypothetical protein
MTKRIANSFIYMNFDSDWILKNVFDNPIHKFHNYEFLNSNFPIEKFKLFNEMHGDQFLCEDYWVRFSTTLV